MEFQWFCRQTTETFCHPGCPEGSDQLLYENGTVAPEARAVQADLDAAEARLGPSVFQSGGCFGGGPGAVFGTLGGMLVLKSEQFAKPEIQYEMQLQLR